jgi:hypothetical protein
MSDKPNRFAVPAYVSVSAFAVVMVVTTAILSR